MNRRFMIPALALVSAGLILLIGAEPLRTRVQGFVGADQADAQPTRLSPGEATALASKYAGEHLARIEQDIDRMPADSPARKQRAFVGGRIVSRDDLEVVKVEPLGGLDRPEVIADKQSRSSYTVPAGQTFWLVAFRSGPATTEAHGQSVVVVEILVSDSSGQLESSTVETIPADDPSR